MSEPTGCAGCCHGRVSVPSLLARIDMCGSRMVYLPTLMPIENRRPEWCPGFVGKVIGERLEVIGKVETKQEELGL